MRLTEGKIQTIMRALEVAAEVYEKDALQTANAPGHEQISTQFKAQAKECKALAAELDQAGTVQYEAVE